MRVFIGRPTSATQSIKAFDSPSRSLYRLRAPWLHY
jgi:hypothetical protein